MYQNNEFQLLICLKIDLLNFWQKGVQCNNETYMYAYSNF